MTGQQEGNGEEKRGEIAGMSYGKLMTALLIPRDSRTNPRRILGGVAFIVFIAFFVFAALSRSCHRDETPATQSGAQSSAVMLEARSV